MVTSLSLRQLAVSLTLATFVTALAACGGGGSSDSDSGSAGTTYSGVTSAAVVTEENKDEAAQASIEGATAAADADGLESAPGYGSVAALITDNKASADTIERVKAIVLETAGQQHAADDVVSGAGITVPSECGGSFTISASGDTTTITYNNYCVDDSEGAITISGKAIIKTVGEDWTQITYQNMIVTYPGGERERIPNMTITCDAGTCSTTADFVGSDGEVYRIENAIVSETSGFYDVSVRVYDANLGYVDIIGEGLMFCEVGGIGQGTITIQNATEEGLDIQVVFTDCGVYTVNILYVL